MSNNPLRIRMDEVVEALEIHEVSEEFFESPQNKRLLDREADSMETHIDKNLEIIHKMEQNTDLLERFVLTNPVSREDEGDSFEKGIIRPGSKSSGSLVRSFQLKSEKSMDSLKKHLYLPAKVFQAH